jgi:2-aminoethylphosphonate transport system ATP-binding protein
VADAEVRVRVKECLALVGMDGYLGRLPRELSGGQQQRVAIARALAIRPDVLLLDEPLSALDAQIRRSMVEEIARLHRELPDLTILYVTHDQGEALTLAHRIAIMRDGRLVALGRSRELYHRPPNRFAADFLGRANLLPVEVAEIRGTRAQVRFGAASLLAEAHGEAHVGLRCLLCVRPHDVALAPGAGRNNRLEGRVCSALWQGDQHSIAVEVEGAVLRVACVPLDEPPAAGTPLAVHFAAERCCLVPDHDG